MLKGIDVSHWDGKIDWARVKSAGVGFVYIKATEGTNFVDAQFACDLAGAKAVGLPFGLSHFLLPNNNGAAQADWFLSHAGDLSGQLVPMLGYSPKVSRITTPLAGR